MDSETLIRKYLLAQLEQDNCVQFEEQILLDEAFLEQAQIIEDDLIEAYLEGTLPDKDKDAFCSAFLSTPYGHRKTLIAMALKKHLTTGATPQVSERITNEKMPLWIGNLAWTFTT